MKAVVAIAGSLRNLAEFERTVDSAYELAGLCPMISEIRLATTDEEAEVQAGVASFQGRTPRLDVRVRPQPPFIAKGHRLHQIRQWDAALQGLDPETWVIKLRTDKLLLPPATLKDCLDRISADEAAHDGKFGVIEGHLFLPWFINDMVFVTQAKSLRQLVSYDVSADIFAPALSTEQAIWSHMLEGGADAFVRFPGLMPLHSRVHPETDKFEAHDLAFEGSKTILRNYWQCVSTRCFSLGGRRIAAPNHLKIGSIELTSDKIFTRYGLWGTSFVDPSVCGDLLALLDAPNSR
jgi:hypothetical protein